MTIVQKLMDIVDDYLAWDSIINDINLYNIAHLYLVELSASAMEMRQKRKRTSNRSFTVDGSTTHSDNMMPASTTADHSSTNQDFFSYLSAFISEWGPTCMDYVLNSP
ncbi:hypothetical protein ACFE04_018318 [Oxalis oulophora]